MPPVNEKQPKTGTDQRPGFLQGRSQRLYYVEAHQNKLENLELYDLVTLYYSNGE